MPKITLERTCPFCSRSTRVRVDKAGHDRWRDGELIQVALPELDEDCAELVMTGICATCWTNAFPEEDDSE